MMNTNKIISTLFFIALMTIGDVTAQTGTQIQYLSGTDKDHTVTWDFFCTGGRKSGYWTTIQVPSCWELQGFGVYNYGRDNFSYGNRVKFADEQGLYRHTFDVPASWKDRDVWIVFEGSMTDTEVKINGQSAGDIHQGSFYRFKYNITDKLKFGASNTLEATVSKMSTNRAVNNAERFADYWIFGGIFRPVYLESFPRQHISHLAVAAPVTGDFLVDVNTVNLAKEQSLTAEVSYAGKVVATFTGKAAAGNVKTRIEGKVPGVKPWTAETPDMYKVTVSLKDGKKLLHQTSDVFGFRTVEVRQGDGIYLNGTKIKMKGVNRHVFWPESGRTVSREVALLDIERVKGMNMNAIRCSHYPPDKDFLYLCDSLGVYVLDELAGWQTAYDTIVGEKLVREMVERDVNHPSILLWSNGNEGGHNKDLVDDYTLYDPSKRTVIHAHNRPGNAINGIECDHYVTYTETSNYLKQDTLILMTTEFLHCQDDGGGGAGLEDYWESMWSSPIAAGGFLWALLDEAVVRTDMSGHLDAQLVHANDGVLGPHREKEGSYYAIREIYTPVKSGFKTLPANFTGSIPLENRFFFTNLNQCTFTWQLVDYARPGEYISDHAVKQEGTLKGPNVTPLGVGNLQLPLPSSWKSHDALTLAIFDPAGIEVMNYVYRIRNNAEILTGIVTKNGESPAVYSEEAPATMRFGRPGGGAPTPATTAPATTTTASPATSTATSATATPVTDTKSVWESTPVEATPAPPPPADSLIYLTGNGITVSISKQTGLLKQVAGGGRARFNNGPGLVTGNATVKGFTHQQAGDAQVVEFNYDGDMKFVRWTMHPSGWLELDYAYALEGNFDFTGVTFNYPEKQVVNIRWLGKGPYRVWKNRPQGMAFDVWAKLYNNTQTGASPWIYPEFKGYHGDMVWTEFSTMDGRFVVASANDNMFLRLFDFQALDGAEVHPPLPGGDISFLDHIPATGTKMATNINQRPNVFGPTSQLNEVNGTFTRKLYFYFGYPEPK